ncbi:tRNA pseudouridine(55) synthase TruB [Lutimonas halocynthiae]|uniref:tRNA pseudouridine(55) synthase TruB n=1 Tax=Lutimonas halocynthiae TaxID=1446477 RepID=UPI0025B36AFA|nr:tRNA pseudouridine(55) synthase TruB [Lutimonas halocynthiae]MDN3641963.1 tRNA pseudouridine(55) synthase TruB [Lutimonas halocynthiae]
MNIEDFKNGQVLVIDKPLNWTSFQVVNKIRWAIRKKFKIKKIKVGHAGTLDPLATGILIVCTGKQTKKIIEYQAEGKEYTGTITLGGTTPSFDLETEIDQSYPTEHITKQNLLETAASFVGKIQQKPPLYSALKKDGVRLYHLARKGEQVEINAREVEIFAFEITDIAMPVISFRIECSKGTYIRSIANDFGEKLNSGGHLSSLRRTKSGSFKIESASTLKSFLEQLGNETMS